MSMPKKIDPDAIYVVKVKRVVPIGLTRLRPGQPGKVKGRVLQQIKDDVLEATLAVEKHAGDCVIPPTSKQRLDLRPGR